MKEEVSGIVKESVDKVIDEEIAKKMNEKEIITEEDLLISETPKQ